MGSGWYEPVWGGVCVCVGGWGGGGGGGWGVGGGCGVWCVGVNVV